MYTLKAVQEVWRILKPHGILCDVHPVNAFVPLEIVHQEQHTNFATLDRRHAIEGIKIAQTALGIACHEGYFQLEEEANFITHRYWKNVQEIKDWYSGTQVHLSEEVIEQARAMLKVRSKDARLAAQRIFLMGRYRKMQRNPKNG